MVDPPKKWPDFLILGAAKAGTTALFKALGRHPRVFCPRTKEPRFFSYADSPPLFEGPGGAANAMRVVSNKDSYNDLFADCPKHSLAFEASTEYLACAGAPAAAARHVPAARLIVILRHPVERAFSQFLHIKAEGLEPCSSFEAAWHSCRERMAAGWRPAYDYRGRGFYGAQLTCWREHFAPEQLLVLFYEDWLRSPAEVLGKIWEHLGLDPVPDPIITKENVSSRQPRWPWLHRHMVDHRNPIRMLAQRTLPLPVRDAITGAVGALNLKPGRKLDPELRARLAVTYSDDLKIVEDITGRNLAAWRT